jgi:hypothetical protein
VPLSHNVIEAISSGCIPIIEREYANLFYPPLIDGETALIYDDLATLNGKIIEAFGIDERRLAALQTNIGHYYSENCSPEATISKMLNPSIEVIHLVSFSSSAKHIKRTAKRLNNATIN